MRKSLTLAVIGASLLLVSAASANLSISKLWVEFRQGDQERDDLVIRNDSEDRYYVTVSVSEIIDAGTGEEKKVSETDPEKLGVLVTPNQLVLEPGAIRSIRLVSLNRDLAKDRIYRVLVAPQVGTIKAKGAEAEARGIAIKMLAAYDVLVVDRPTTSEAVLVPERFPDHLALKNTGNTNILVAEGHVCPSALTKPTEDGQCTPIEAQRLYAGNQMTVALKNPSDRVFVKTRTGPAANFVEKEF